MSFRPRTDGERYQSFWSVGAAGFGVYRQERRAGSLTATLEHLHGSGIELDTLSLPHSEARTAKARRGGTDVRLSLDSSTGSSELHFAPPVRLSPGVSLEIELTG